MRYAFRCSVALTLLTILSSCSAEEAPIRPTDDEVRARIQADLQEMDEYQRESWVATCDALSVDARVREIVGREVQVRIGNKLGDSQEAEALRETVQSRAELDVDGMLIRGAEMVELRVRECDLGLGRTGP
jgi:hypothetical protein